MSLLEGVETTEAPANEAADTTGQEVAEQSTDTTTETATTETTDANAPGFLYADGIEGQGEAPEWFLSKKYKTVEEQAKAYPELQSKMGAFVGSPKDGKYEIEGVNFDENPLMGTVAAWGAEKGLSNEGLTELYSKVNELAQKQIAEDQENAMKQLGEKGQQRLQDLAQWGRNNLDADAYIQFQGLAQNAGQVEVLEKLIGMTKNSKMVDKTKVEDSNTRQNKETELKKMQLATNENGKRLMDVDPSYRQKVIQMQKEFYGN